ncbi:D-alanyl-D-alanine carboxypeptidase family protein [Methylomagnum sp.]
MIRSAASILLTVFVILLSGPVSAGPYSGLVVDADTDRVLYERNADELRHPASLTKMMTLYMVFDALSKGELFLDTAFRASSFAIMRPPSRLGLEAGDTLTVEQAILGLVTRSANDVASVIAESMAGSDSAFGFLMTEKARQLGMSQSVFRNPSGLPDPNQVTTAWDMYRLGKALQRNFPQYYTYFSTPRFYYEGHGFDNHNHLMETYAGMDGIKTGFINKSGFNLVASAKRDGKRLIGVVFGGPSARGRDQHMREILDDGFAQLNGAEPSVITAAFDRPAPPVLLARPRQAEPEAAQLAELVHRKRAARVAGHAVPRARATHAVARHGHAKAPLVAQAKNGKHGTPVGHAPPVKVAASRAAAPAARAEQGRADKKIVLASTKGPAKSDGGCQGHKSKKCGSGH